MATGNPLSTKTVIAAYPAPSVLGAHDQRLEMEESTDLPTIDREVRLLRRALGSAAVAPWNAPTLVAIGKVASALAAG